MSEVRLKPSHPDFEHVDDLQRKLALAKNPHMVSGLEMDMPEPERNALIEVLTYELSLLLASVGLFNL